MWWLVVFIIICAVIGTIDERWKKEHGVKPRQRDRRKKYNFFENDEKYVSRAKRRREEKRRKRDEQARRKWYDDYDTYTDKNGNEHTLDYHNYCDECDEYHEE